MVQLSFDIVPVAIGAATFLTHRLFSVRAEPKVSKCDSTREEVLEKHSRCTRRTTMDELTLFQESCAEPSPEPLPDEEETHTAASTRAVDWKWCFTLGGFFTALALCAALAARPSEPIGASIINAPTADDARVWHPTVEQLHRQELAAELAAESASVKESTVRPPTLTAATKVHSVGLSTNSSTYEDEDDGHVNPTLRLPLTRQQMKVNLVNGVVHYKSAYWGTLRVGSPAVAYKMVFDTGSGLLILPSSYCHSETCRVHKRYRKSKSESAKDIDQDGSAVKPGEARDQITVSFGTGEVQGVFIEERVCVSEQNDSSQQRLQYPRAGAVDASAEDLPPGCMRMGIVAATDMTPEPFKYFKFDGVLGLGLVGLSQNRNFNFLDVVARSVGDIASKQQNTFAISLAEDASEITFGGWSKDQFEGKLGWAPVYQPALGHWLVRIKAIRANGEKISFCEDGTCRGVVDTGTSLVAVPSKAFPLIFERLRHTNPSDGDCTAPGPQLSIEIATVGGKSFALTLDPADYARVDTRFDSQTSPAYVGFGQVEESKPTEVICKPSLMSMDMPAPIGPKLFILGEPVLRKYYTIYDTTAPPKIGFGLSSSKRTPMFANPVEKDDDSWFFDEDTD